MSLCIVSDKITLNIPHSTFVTYGTAASVSITICSRPYAGWSSRTRWCICTCASAGIDIIITVSGLCTFVKVRIICITAIRRCWAPFGISVTSFCVSAVTLSINMVLNKIPFYTSKIACISNSTAIGICCTVSRTFSRSCSISMCTGILIRWTWTAGIRSCTAICICRTAITFARCNSLVYVIFFKISSYIYRWIIGCIINCTALRCSGYIVISILIICCVCIRTAGRASYTRITAIYAAGIYIIFN